LEQQVVVLAQPRQLEMVGRRVKAMNSDLDRLNELKSGRKDASSIAFGLTSAMNAQNANAANAEAANKEGSLNDNETKVMKVATHNDLPTKFFVFRLTNYLLLWKKSILF
jgi:hypothetical protein